MTTLVIQPLPGIGDMVWHASHIRAIAAASPGGRVTLLTKRRSMAEQLFSGEGIIERVLWLERDPGRHSGVLGPFRLAAELKPHAFSRAVILHKNWRYALSCWMAGIPERQGYGFGLQRPFLSSGPFLPPDLKKARQFEQASGFLAALRLPDDPTPRLMVDPAAAAFAEGIARASAGPWLALGVGASGPDKRWPIERFARLARELVGCGWPGILLVGGPGDAHVRPVVDAALEGTGATLCDTFGLALEQSIALVARSDLFIGNDSGLLNVAAALRVPSIGLFGATKPLNHAANLHAVLPEDGRIDIDGIGRISLNQVFEAAARIRRAPAAVGARLSSG